MALECKGNLCNLLQSELYIMEDWLEGKQSRLNIKSRLNTVRILLNQFFLELRRVGLQEVENSASDQVNEEMNLNIANLTQCIGQLQQQAKHQDWEGKKSEYCYQGLKSMMLLPDYCEGEEASHSFKKRKTKIISRGKTRGPYRSYTVEEKNYVVHLHLMGMNFASISKELEIPQKNVVRWCREGYSGKEGTRIAVDSEMEEELAFWLKEQLNQSIISSSDIQEKAEQLTSDPQFKASLGWLRSFLRRYDIQADLDCKAQQKVEQ